MQDGPYNLFFTTNSIINMAHVVRIENERWSLLKVHFVDRSRWEVPPEIREEFMEAFLTFNELSYSRKT